MSGRQIWWPVGIGVATVCLPTLRDLAEQAWSAGANAHGPLVLGVLLWQVIRERAALAGHDRASLAGMPLFLSGLALYVLGRSQSLLLIEVAALLPLLAGVVWVLCGLPALRRLGIAAGMLVLLQPWPAWALDDLIAPVAGVAAQVAGTILHGTPYRSFSFITAVPGTGWEEGLNCLPGIAVMGVVYTCLAGERSQACQLGLVAAIVPALMLVAILHAVMLPVVGFHFGMNAALGVDRHLAGMLLFAAGLLLYLGIDWLLGMFRLVPSAEAA